MKRKTLWHQAPELFTMCSAASNLGIVINMASKWVPEIMKIGHGLLGGIAYYADVLIYVFKALIRLTKLAGRCYFHIQFDDEDRTHNHQKMFCDILSLVNFSLAILSFTSVIASGAVAITLGWTFGLIGIGIVTYTDYFLPKKQAEHEFDTIYKSFIQGNDFYPISQLLEKYQEKKDKNYEFKLQVGLMVGLTFLLVFGSASMFAPTGIAAMLSLISKIASIYLAGIAFFQFSNWIKSKSNSYPQFTNNIDNDFYEYKTSHSDQTQEQLLLNFTKENKISFFHSPAKEAAQTRVEPQSYAEIFAC